MSHAADAARLVSQFSALCQRCAILGDHLADASRELAAGGALPGVALIDELDVARSEFADIRRQALDLAAALNACSPSGAHEAATLEALETLLRSVAEATERQATSEARRRALAVLERVMSLRHREDAEFGPLAACHASAAELTAVISGVEWPATHPELTALADGSHPFSQLADFVEHQSELDDAGWELLHEAVAASLGRPLAVAAARGKLVFAQQSSTVQDDEDDWPTVSIATLPPEQPVGSLVWRALLADRPAVAFLSATLADGAAERVDAPVWLLRSLVLSRHVHYPNGDIALQLAEDFSSCEPTELGAGSEGQEVPQALRLLVAAAALRPALVAPETGAWAILRALPEAPALRSTQAYLRQVAEYGERNAAIASHTLAPLLSSTVWRDRMEDLRREVGAWRVRFLGMRSSYPPATAVWRRWLLPDGLIHALLDPVTLEVRGLETARGLVERLSNDAQIRWEIDDTDRRLLGRAHGPDIAIRPDALEQLAERVREAVGFVRRWIALEECRPNRPDDEPRKAGLRLQQQLAELRPAVIDELAAAQAEARSLPLQAALAECRAALSDVDALLDDSSSLALREPPLAALLYADLLHVAGSCLDENWLPCRGSRASRDRLEQLLGMDHRSAWRATFERRRLEKDHLATLEVIQCLEMQREGARELQAARAEDLQRCRNALRHDVEQTRELVDVAAAEGRLDDDTRARLLAVVEQIGMIVPDVLRFEPRHARLRHVREELERIREAMHSRAEPAAERNVGRRSLLAGGAWREATSLFLAGLGENRPESSSVIARALSLANYEQDAIQRLAALLSQRAVGGLVTRDVVDSVASSREGAETLTADVRARLEGDPRQRILLYSLALGYRDAREDANPAGEGVSSEWLREQADLWCPESFRASATGAATADSVEEMLGLGLLRSLGPDRFIPGSPNLLPYLGREEELIGTLLECDNQPGG